MTNSRKALTHGGDKQLKSYKAKQKILNGTSKLATPTYYNEIKTANEKEMGLHAQLKAATFEAAEAMDVDDYSSTSNTDSESDLSAPSAASTAFGVAKPEPEPVPFALPLRLTNAAARKGGRTTITGDAGMEMGRAGGVKSSSEADEVEAAFIAMKQYKAPVIKSRAVRKGCRHQSKPIVETKKGDYMCSDCGVVMKHIPVFLPRFATSAYPVN